MKSVSVPIATEIAFWIAALGLSVDTGISLIRLSTNAPFYIAFVVVCVVNVVGIAILRKWAPGTRWTRMTIWLAAGIGILLLVVLNLTHSIG